MFRIASHALIGSLATLLLVVGGLLLGLLIRLQYGPLNLAPVENLIISGIQAELPADWQVNWDHCELAWDQATKNIVVLIKNQHILNAQKQPVLQIQEARLTTHLFRLFEGRWVPRDIWLSGVHVNLAIAATNAQSGNAQSTTLGQGYDALKAVWRDVHRINIDKADLLLTQGDAQPIALQEVSLQAVRHHQQVQMLMRAARQVYATQKFNNFTLRYTYDLKKEISSVVFDTQNIFIADIMPYLEKIPALQFLKQTDWQIPLTLHVEGKESGTTPEWQLDFSAVLANGFISLPEKLPYAIAVKACKVSGKIIPAVIIETKNCQLAMPHGEMNITATAQQHDDQWNVQTAIDRADIKDIDYFWPPEIVPGGYRWLKANMQAGLLDQIKVNLVYDPKVASEIAGMDGGFQMHNVTSKFLKPLQPITEANGSAVLKNDTLTFTINGGKYLDQIIGETKLYMTKLFDDLPMIEINTQLNGPLATLLQTINHEPYYLINYSWLPDKTFKNVSGNYQGKLMMKFPMLADLQMKQIDYDASGTAQNIVHKNFWHNLPLNVAAGSFRLTPNSFDVKSEAGLGTLSGNIIWQQKKGEINSQEGTVTGRVTGAQLSQFGWPFEKYIKGTIPWKVDLQQSGDAPMRLAVLADLTPAGIEYTPESVIKPLGQNGRLSLQVILNDKNTELNTIQLTGPQMNVKGRVQLTDEGDIQNMELNPLHLGNRTDATVKASNQHWIIRGRSLDLSPLLKTSTQKKADIQKEKNNHPAQSFDLQTGQLWLDENIAIDQPTIQLARAKNCAWERVNITGKVGQAAAPINVQWQPAANGQTLTADIADLGLALQAFGQTDYVVGGHLTATGDGTAGKKLQANANVTLTDFKIRNMPLLARIIGATSPSGLLNLLNGSGLGFNELTAEIKYQEDSILLQQGKMHSAAFGLTFGGIIDQIKNTLDLKGTAIPLYAVNYVLSHIPLIGDLLAGADDAVVGASYHASGPLDDPNVSVNPLSALTPGFIRDLFFANSSDEPDLP